MLSEKTATPKKTPQILYDLIYMKYLGGQIHRAKKWNGSCQGLESSGNRDMLAKDYLFSVIRGIRSENLMCSIVMVVNNTVLYI